MSEVIFIHFEVNTEFRLKSTILDRVGLDGSGQGRAENKNNSSQLELGLGLSLAILLVS